MQRCIKDGHSDKVQGKTHSINVNKVVVGSMGRSRKS